MFKNLNDMYDASVQYDAHKDNFTYPREELSFDDECRIVVPQIGWADMLEGKTEGDTRLHLTEWALTQVCNKLGPPPLAYMRDCPQQLRADNLNYWLGQTHTNKEWFVRSYSQHCRAVLSADYTPISNTEVLDALIKVVGDTPYELSRPHVGPDRTYVRLTVKTENLDRIGPDDSPNGRGGGNYGIGFAAKNGETGGDCVNLWPYTKRISCDNSIAYGDECLTIKHIHHTPAFVMGAIKEWAGKALKIATARLDKIVEAELENIPAFGDVVRRLGTDNKWSDDTVDKILIGSEGNQSRMGLVHGLSFAGARLENEDQDDSLALELFAGKVLMNQDNVFTKLAERVAVNA